MIPDPATALVYTSDAGLRARVRVLGAQVAGARALLEEITTVGTRWSERVTAACSPPRRTLEIVARFEVHVPSCSASARATSSASNPAPGAMAMYCRPDRARFNDPVARRGSKTACYTLTTSLGGDPMSRFFYAQEIARPEDVIPQLAKQELHWKKGYSAYELAHSWVDADDIPPSVRSVLDSCPDYAGAHLVEGLFERDVDLRTPGRRSQTDLLAFVNLAHDNAVIAVEGKVDEPFGELVSTWNDHRPGKECRLEAPLAYRSVCEFADVGDIRYQLLHRTASAIYEAQRYRTKTGAHARALVSA